MVNRSRNVNPEKKKSRIITESIRGKDISISELLKGDFISPTGQPDLLGKDSLAHQNAWDFEAMVVELSVQVLIKVILNK